MVNLLSGKNYRTRASPIIADFAAGEGSLLDAAASRWPSAKFVATDLDIRVIARLRRSRASWNIGKCDFLSATSRARSRVLAPFRDAIDFILLNPPFTCRGGTRHVVAIDSNQIRCGTAAAFLLHAVSFLAPTGQLIAVLPASFLTSKRDESSRQYLASHGCMEVVGHYGRNTFSNCFPRTVLVRFSKNKLSSRDSNQSPMPASGRSDLPSSGKPMRLDSKVLPISLRRPVNVQIVRGVTQTHTLGKTDGVARRFVHTTELRHDRIRARVTAVPGRARTIIGPSILLPRVGSPSRTKIANYQGKQPLVLSDCVFGLQCSERADAATVYSIIHKHWEELAQLYGGTGARYLTTAALEGFLRKRGIQVEQLQILDEGTPIPCIRVFQASP
ncbi:methyltransferase [Corallococcus llansteffanensis]